MIAIVDYGMGNLLSVQNALQVLNMPFVVTSSKDQIAKSKGIIVPGVGAFPDAMKNLRQKGLDKVLKESGEKGKPMLGICLGMQLFFEEGIEGERCEGLSFFRGKIKKIEGKVKVPHMGWNSLYYEKSCPLLNGIPEHNYVYFVHSYYAEIRDKTILDAYCNYENNIPAVVSNGSIYGVQFHPEKSGVIGMRMLKNFGELIK